MLQAGAAEQALNRDPDKTRQALYLIRTTGLQAIAEMGTLVRLIRHEPGAGRDPQPTLADIDRLAATTRAAGLEVQVRTEGTVRELPATVELNAYRVVQEGLTNALKHTRQAKVSRRPALPTRRRRGGGLRRRLPRRSRTRLPARSARAARTGRRIRRPVPGRARPPRRLDGPGVLPDRVMTRVLLADDQVVVRAGLRTILESTADADLDIVGEAADGAEAVALTNALQPDVVLMDIRMPVLDGIEATRRLARSTSSARVLVLTTYGLDEYVYEALRAGAAGFLLKTDPPHRIVDAVRVVAAGDALLGPETTRRLIERFLAGPRPNAPRPSALDTLTDRETDVLRQVARFANQEVAANLFIGEGTVKTHVARILAKLELRDRVQIVVYAYEHAPSTRQRHQQAAQGEPPPGSDACQRAARPLRLTAVTPRPPLTDDSRQDSSSAEDLGVLSRRRQAPRRVLDLCAARVSGRASRLPTTSVWAFW